MNEMNSIQIKTNIKSGNFLKKLHTFAEFTIKHGGCDKCNQPVNAENNAAVYDYIMSGQTDWTNFFRLIDI